MKKKMKINIIFVFSLVLILILFNTCKRSTPDQKSPMINIESPYSPSGFITKLVLFPSPSMVNLRTTSTVTITATLTKLGIPLNNRAIIFDLSDEFGEKIELGLYDDDPNPDAPLVERSTNESGVATVTYNAPPASRLLRDFVVFIRAIVVGEGDEAISDMAPIQLIGPPITDRLLVTAGDPILYANPDVRESTTITAYLSDQNGPMAFWTLLFEICDASGNRVSIGTIDSSQGIIKDTLLDGTASVFYEAPLGPEIPDLAPGKSITLYVRATLIWMGQNYATDAARIIIAKPAE